MCRRGVSALATAALAALVLASAAPAHVVVRPSFLEATRSADLELDVPNERGIPMDGFLMLAPKGFRVLAAPSVPGWHSARGDRTAVWHGTLAPRLQETFTVRLESPTTPGPATFQMEQHYPDGGIVRWPVELTVVPAPDNPSENLGVAVVAGIGGLLVLGLLGVLFWRRTTGPLQER